MGERGEGRFRCAGPADEADRHGHSGKRDPVAPSSGRTRPGTDVMYCDLTRGHSGKRDPVAPSSGRTRPGTDVMYCDLTRGHVLVHASRSPGSPVVGYLEQGGAGNWFVTEMKGETYRDGAAENNRWASTQADNGRWGWTPEVCFAGGGNYEDDASLLMPGSCTCANTCAPVPFWAR
ncbi:hypothetical protein [Streptomyces sp. NPDC055105]|uniref:hypothetical protein n=1 Tax=Streptomyces sp. NPDC055105 TaxID=3365719 RepID=UPI0037CF1DD7